MRATVLQYYPSPRQKLERGTLGTHQASVVVALTSYMTRVKVGVRVAVEPSYVASEPILVASVLLHGSR